MKITMIGSGYVGLVSGTCLAEIGHEVVCMDQDPKKIAQLQQGHSPIYELGLEALIQENSKQKKLSFTTSLQSALEGSEVVFIAVGTPAREDGACDLRSVFACAKDIATYLQNDVVVIVKSTVPVGTCDQVEEILQKRLLELNKNFTVCVVSNPEFLKEGNGVKDFMAPDRIVVGLSCGQGEEVIHNLYRPFTLDDPSKLMLVERRAAEMIKYAANSMLATRISFMNELSRLCEKTKVDIDQVRIGIGHDPRIGKKFLFAGPGYGGSCFPKDTDALISLAESLEVDMPLLKAVNVVNFTQKAYAASKIQSYFSSLKDKKIALWGLAYKPGTDDVRESPAAVIIKCLLEDGAHVFAHDPQAMHNFALNFAAHRNLHYSASALEAVQDADALVLVTEWHEYQKPNWNKIAKAMQTKCVFDFRNQYDYHDLKNLDFAYFAIGRPDDNY